MAKYTPAETTKWVADNLRQKEGVLDVEVLSDQVIFVSRSRYEPFVAAIISATRVEAVTVRSLVKSEFDVEIIANVPKESYWTGEALRLAQANSIATGAYGELLRAINHPEVRTLLPKETEFIERGLRQHDRVLSFEQVHDWLYRISRIGLPDLTAVMLYEYELTADHLRTARDRYGRFTIAVITNPNGRTTTSAEETAETIGVEILEWGPFLGRLNKK